jgi:ABC-type amino acid transport substrate-binding protein
MQSAQSESSRRHRVLIATLGIAVLATSLLDAAPAAAAGTLDRIRQAGKIELGYRNDARPFSYKDESGKAAGYSIALCEKIADDVKTELGLPSLTVDWVPVTLEDRFQAVQQGKVDLLCGADTATLTRGRTSRSRSPSFRVGSGQFSGRRSRPASRGPGRAAVVWCDLARVSRADPGEEDISLSSPDDEQPAGWPTRKDSSISTPAWRPVDNYQDGHPAPCTIASSDVFFGDRPHPI